MGLISSLITKGIYAGLKPSAKSLLPVVASYLDDGGECDLTIDELAEMSGIAPSGVNQALSSLEQSGVIVKRQRVVLEIGDLKPAPQLEPSRIEAPVTCEQCGQTFRNMKGLNMHRMKKHGKRAA